MSGETKKRLLLSKWRLLQTDAIDALEVAARDRDNELTDTLLTVRYWLHDGIVHGKLVSDPRRLLRRIEETLG